MTAQPRPSTGELGPGTALGKYEILRKLATGGMAEIYLARVRGAAGFEKLVVVKRILPSAAEDPAFVQMFLDEARLAATLQHPNIADVYDAGEAFGMYFFAMEFVHGQDARSIRTTTRKRGERIPHEIALAIVHGTAAALDYAHEKAGPDGPLGLVHRDISSSNILVSYDGAVKLVDFGIARAASRVTKTRTGQLKGKIPYMSPEQCRGQALDRRSDLFSLGVVLFELTVGRRPFRGDSDFVIMEQIVHGSAPRPTSFDPQYPPELERIVLRLLERDLDARYQTAEELLHDLDPFLAASKLWISAKPIGRYMRGLFGDKIEAWEYARQEGVTLGQHVAQTITAESMRSELHTPPSAFPAAAPEAPRRSTSMSSIGSAAAQVYPATRAPRRGLVIALAAILTLLGAAVGVVGLRELRTSEPPARAEPPAAATPSATQPAPPPAPPPPTIAPPPPAGPGIAKPPETEQPAPPPKPRAIPAKPAQLQRPAPPRPTKPVEPKALETKPAQTKTDTPKPKETPWDPNSPYFPPSQ